MNERIYNVVAELPESIRIQDQKAFFGSIHATLNHILWADKIWLSRFLKGGYSFDILTEDTVAGVEGQAANHRHEIESNFDRLEKERMKVDQDMVRWIGEGFSESDFVKNLEYQNTKGSLHSTPIFSVLTHLFNHQTHHRGQVTALLFQNGIDPGVTDLIYYLRLNSN
ncbi:damage-inducible protein DinB [Leptospira tipperaryensis]|uniref:Damage-inducible protein DinB n=2 Tax=Leptospira tipperaryensis TaxID=2564040 RepID=A0A1D7USZ6_9LEPT|nr:damage-inducible protein DinB [Leptospira tipperaryensis]